MKKTIIALSVASATFGFLQAVLADDNYPGKPIQVIVPVNPGGDTDLNARVFSKYLEEELDTSMVIVNVGGGGGTVGMRRVMESQPDGHTVLFFHGEGMVPKLAGLVDFGLETFQMVATAIVDDTTVLATHKSAPYTTMDELVEYAQENPGNIEFGMMTGGYPHLIGVALEQELDVELNLVDVGGNAAKIVALRGGHTDLINVQYGLVKDYFESGDFINLGLLSTQRNPMFEDVPTAEEQGYPLEFNKFFYFAMPKDTPISVVEKFSSAVEKVIENPEYQEEAATHYLYPTYMDPEAATQYAEQQYEEMLQYQEFFLNNH
ncbi:MULTISPECIES: tripartite tricarboxylate transporter substrate binding protein [Halomonadaceae]|uniref:tripartite tricarboxylate transporter substrate binding protein n=1 Tax=Halomonadaceae TaxID=28256 RepID=UPI0015973FF0|nr:MULTISPECIES: tripartite tricarboxylate transporter substrate binding protein [Halomonas]QJQ95340.1 tripartite tricarboxylate transporter substrate binding protein [Halomonas sp. PA5]